MSATERRLALLRLLAEIDQRIAECEDLASQPVLADDEIEYVAIHLKMRRDARKRVEELIELFSTH